MLRPTRRHRFRYTPSQWMRVLFMGGDDVSIVTLRALHGAMASSSVGVSALDVLLPTVKSSRRKDVDSQSGSLPTGVGRLQQFCQQNGLRWAEVPHSQRLLRVSAASAGNPSPPVYADDDAIRHALFPSARASEVDQTIIDYDVGIVVSFRYFLPPRFLNLFPMVINMHPSLLPHYRGASPIHHTLLHGHTTGGATIIKIRPGEGMDCGDILMQRELPISADEMYAEYCRRVCQLGAEMVVDAVRSHTELQRLWDNARVQPNKEADIMAGKQAPYRTAPKMKKGSVGGIQWSSMSPTTIYNMWRALCDGYTVHCTVSKAVTPIGHRLVGDKRNPTHAVVQGMVRLDDHSPVDAKLLGELSTLAAKGAVQPGSAYIPTCKVGETLVVAVWCGGDEAGSAGWVLLSRLTLRGGKPTAASDFIHGLALKRGVAYPGVFLDAPPTQAR